MTKMIFLEINEEIKLKGLNIIFRKVFSKNDDFDINFQNNLSSEEYIKHCSQTCSFWLEKRKLYQSVKQKKTLIRRLFEVIFN